MNNPQLRIFVSSTYLDLINYRLAAEKAINDLGQKYKGIEYIRVMNEEPTKARLDLVEKCKIFIGIYAWWYGYIPEGKDISITEQEYIQARKLGRPCFCYFVDEGFFWNPRFIDTGPAKVKLKRFKNIISNEHVYENFTTIGSLQYNLFCDISKWLVNN